MSNVRDRTKTHTGFGFKKNERMRPIGRPKHRWENNNKRDEKQGGRAWTRLFLLKKGTLGGL
jgi:hypothetical protein